MMSPSKVVAFGSFSPAIVDALDDPSVYSRTPEGTKVYTEVLYADMSVGSSPTVLNFPNALGVDPNDPTTFLLTFDKINLSTLKQLEIDGEIDGYVDDLIALHKAGFFFMYHIDV